ncbi:MAG: branched-chain amino acid ABC transporter permease [Actinomycetota bacterium]|nr:branched-chain amino acid ABC transporter permease [Actinomycetota bacterium]
MSLFLLSLGFGIVTAAVLALSSVGLSLQFGVTNFVNFAYGAYLGFGMFLTYTLASLLHFPLWLSVVLGCILTGVLAVVIDLVILEPFVRRRTSGFFMLIVTFGLQLLLLNIIQAVWGVGFQSFTSGSGSPITIGPFSFTADQLGIVALAVVAMVGIHLLLTRTTLGKSMRAMSDDPSLAKVSGIDTARVTLWTWFISGCLAGLGGVTLALNTVSFQAYTGNNFLFVIFAAVILGGIGKIYGAMLGALCIGLVVEVSGVWLSSAYKLDVAFGVLVLVLLVRPQGIIPTLGKA